MTPRTLPARLAMAALLLCGAGRVHAQVHDHAHMDMSRPMDHEPMSMSGMYGPYAMSREASGTAWQPEAAAHEGLHLMRGPWMLMLHGYADLVYDRQGGPRGREKVVSDNMLMAMASRALGGGTLGLRTMLSAEPATIGKTGYPLLLQTGETADGVSPLIDRQHPHDLFMELAGSWSIARGDHSAFLYAGLPGEPALGPPAFMHRFSGSELPEAPITHHWLDSSHITFGVVTLGAISGNVKLEGSRFHGREPDQERWNIETPKLDSHSFRATWNPSAVWSLQASHGRLHSPEQIEPGMNTDRTTLSVMLDRSTSRHAHARALVHRHVGHVGVVENHGAGIRPHESDDHVEARGLASAVRAEEADDFALAAVDIHAIHHAAAIVNFHEPFCAKDRRRQRRFLWQWGWCGGDKHG